MSRLLIIVLTGTLLLLVQANLWAAEKNGPAAGGTVIGTVVEKGGTPGSGSRRRRAARPRNYIPRWIGGMPDKGGGFDKAMLEKIQQVPQGGQGATEMGLRGTQARPWICRFSRVNKTSD